MEKRKQITDEQLEADILASEEILSVSGASLSDFADAAKGNNSGRLNRTVSEIRANYADRATSYLNSLDSFVSGHLTRG